ncbi:hypothetical protein [Micromonospora sp. HUAS LYJ1]|uniref:hypothetical protein n=1 Tax=Micromonospora sp. HUAS LYJ1 TaxID=3061626 RepID=UPI0026721439|nr:hypothetical protein [Micromonospora sp. HUAS LYJ1]WKU03390.1 hypothetical protein Q2K16_21385 [Micromonospora sp. HUAS LYJ1]
MECHLDPVGVVLLFADTEPLRLNGPAAWLHAVLFAYFRFGASALTTATFLLPIGATHAPDQSAATSTSTSR